MMSELEKKRLRKKVSVMIGLLLITVVIFLLGSLVGKYSLSYGDLFQTLIGQGSRQGKLVLFGIRLPHLVLALLVGIGMGTSGVVMQGLLHNDLASPGTLGVADGSSLFVTLYMAFIAKRVEEPLLLPLLALIGGILSAAIIYKLGMKKNHPISAIKLVMTGVAMSAVYSAMTTLLMYLLDESQMEFLQRWQTGDLWATEWQYILILAGWLGVFGCLILLNSRQLNAIQIGYDFAAALGVNVKVSFALLAFLAIGMSSASVAFRGNFFFLGLIGPHIARGLVGTDTRFLIPAASLASALLILLSTILVENTSLFVNVPAGIVISILSVPYFLYLLIKAG